MGFLSSVGKTISQGARSIFEKPIKIEERINPLARVASNALGMRDGPATSFINQLHRDVRSPVGRQLMPVAGGIAGGAVGSFLAPGAGTVAGATLGASMGRLLAGVENNESESELSRGVGTTAALTAASAGAGYAGAQYGTLGRMAASGASGAAGSAAGDVSAGRPINYTNMAGGALTGTAGSLAGSSVQGTPYEKAAPLMGTAARMGTNYAFREAFPQESPQMEDPNLQQLLSAQQKVQQQLTQEYDPYAAQRKRVQILRSALANQKTSWA